MTWDHFISKPIHLGGKPSNLVYKEKPWKGVSCKSHPSTVDISDGEGAFLRSPEPSQEEQVQMCSCSGLKTLHRVFSFKLDDGLLFPVKGQLEDEYAVMVVLCVSLHTVTPA